jgi:hypothetical protein
MVETASDRLVGIWPTRGRQRGYEKHYDYDRLFGKTIQAAHTGTCFRLVEIGQQNGYEKHCERAPLKDKAPNS